MCISVVCSSYGMYHQFKLDKAREAAAQEVRDYGGEGTPHGTTPPEPVEAFGPWPQHTCRSKQRLITILIVTGFFSGLMSGATGVYGPVVIVLAASTGLTVHEMKAWQTTTGLFETVLCLMCSPLGVSSLNTLWLYYVALLVAGMVGLIIGRSCHKYVDADKAARYIVFIISAAGVNYLSAVLMQDRTVQISISCRLVAVFSLLIMFVAMGLMQWKTGQCRLSTGVTSKRDEPALQQQVSPAILEDDQPWAPDHERPHWLPVKRGAIHNHTVVETAVAKKQSVSIHVSKWAQPEE
jgi:hypothetical protein